MVKRAFEPIEPMDTQHQRSHKYVAVLLDRNRISRGRRVDMMEDDRGRRMGERGDGVGVATGTLNRCSKCNSEWMLFHTDAKRHRRLSLGGHGRPRAARPTRGVLCRRRTRPDFGADFDEFPMLV
ncbi:hypothetical protein EVAR_68951_1 [Eumeta japonica]|uniref:Uncharacterized protein n=1 Tax=Eumeta variegata TaxID=151549 RepID=A0A4C2A7J7_EUMVA|nr:hypothetical protein EVAR_68951_1 [Eumeta japonica]